MSWVDGLLRQQLADVIEIIEALHGDDAQR
jgi:hypothetical protein